MSKSKLLAYLIDFQANHGGAGPGRTRVYDDLCTLQDQTDGVRTCLRDLRRAGLVHEHDNEVRITKRGRTWLEQAVADLARRTGP